MTWKALLFPRVPAHEFHGRLVNAPRPINQRGWRLRYRFLATLDVGLDSFERTRQSVMNVCEDSSLDRRVR